MRSKYLFPIICFLLAGKCRIYAQLPFSQIYLSPLSINPANTGNFVGNYRIGAVYRNAKNPSGAKISKGNLSSDIKILKSVLPENDQLAIGIAGLTEKNIGYGLKSSYIGVSFAYNKSLDPDRLQKIGIGFQMNYTHLASTSPRLVFEDQILNMSRIGFTSTDPYARTNIDIAYPDFNVGLNYQNTFDKNTLSVGLSGFHLNKPYRTYNGGTYELSPVGSLQIGFDRKLSDKNVFYSSLIISGINETTVKNVYLGCRYRSQINQSRFQLAPGFAFRKDELIGTSVIPSLSMFYDKIVLHFCYEINVSKKTTDQRSAIEVGMIFTMPSLSE